MSDALPDVPGLEPSHLAGASFERSRKGFEPTEVRSLLGRAADALRVWADRDAQLVRRVEDLSRRLDEAEEFDEERVAEMLGAETTRIVAAARSAATAMREQAERESAELLESSRAEAEATAEALVTEAATDREAAETARAEAESQAAEIVAGAAGTAEASVTEATEEAERLRSEAAAEAERLTTEAAAEAERLTAEAQQRHDEMVESASSVLEERTIEAKAAAATITATADAELGAARSSAEEELKTASLEAERLLTEAKSAAQAEIERARDQGREMVAEARDVRQRMLRDLAERSRAGRQKMESAKVARAGVMEAIRSAAGQLEETLVELDLGDREIARTADAAAAAVPDDVETVVRELEAELGGDTSGDSGDQSSSGDLDGKESDADSEGESGAEQSEPSGAADVDADGGDPEIGDAPVQDADTPEAEAGNSDAGDTDAADADEPDIAGIASASDDKQMASVHDLFQRLRSTGDAAEHPTTATVTDITDDLETATPVSDNSIDLTFVGSQLDASEGAVALATEDTRAPDARLLDRRDELLEPAERLLARNLKRLVGDEQNEVLDRARRIKRQRAELGDLLDGDAAEAYMAALSEPYLLAAAAGAQMWCETSGISIVEPDAADVADALRRQVGELLELRRVHVREALESHDRSGADASELVDQMRAAYRELRATAVPELAADLAAGGFTAGSRRAAESDDTWRWIPDNGGLPCADAEDNALAGAVVCGAEFPTGDIVPPAHPGCRCIVVPASS